MYEEEVDPKYVHSIDDLRGKLHGEMTDDEMDGLPEEVWQAIDKPEVVAVFVSPGRMTSRELNYNLERIDLRPGQKIIIIPPKGRSGILKDIILGHRKREEFWNLKAGETRKGYDNAGAYSEVRVLNGKDNQWKGWRDPKGYDPVKYAERRSDIEYEVLHDWLQTVGEVDPIAIEITSAGKDPDWSVVTEHSLDIITHPEVDENTQVDEHIYSVGTEFIDLKGDGPKLPKYGGGKHQGAYPNAVPLGGKNGREHFEMTENIDTDGEYIDGAGQLHIRLKPGKKILSLEVAIGDTWFNYKGHGKLQLGWAKFNADLVKEDGGRERFMNTVNVPPQGVLSGGIENEDYITQEGDEIILSSSSGTSYLMGWRIMYDNSPSLESDISETRGHTSEQLTQYL